MRHRQGGWSRWYCIDLCDFGMAVLHHAQLKKHPIISVNNRCRMLTSGYDDKGSQKVQTRFDPDMESSHWAQPQKHWKGGESLSECQVHVHHIFDLYINEKLKLYKHNRLENPYH